MHSSVSSARQPQESPQLPHVRRQDPDGEPAVVVRVATFIGMLCDVKSAADYTGRYTGTSRVTDG